MSACGSPSVNTGTIRGELLISGGAAPGMDQPTNGNVEATGKGGVTYSTAVSGNGQFVLHLAMGTYSLAGTSPNFDGGKGRCLGPDKITVSKNKITKANVNCPAK